MTLDELTSWVLQLEGTREIVKKTEIDFMRGDVHLARLRLRPGTIAIRLPFERCEEILQAHSELFFVSDHYIGWPYVVVKIDDMSAELGKQLLTDSWQFAGDPNV